MKGAEPWVCLNPCPAVGGGAVPCAVFLKLGCCQCCWFTVLSTDGMFMHGLKEPFELRFMAGVSSGSHLCCDATSAPS